MALIIDLPASTTMASTDVMIKDTGSTTQKIAFSDLRDSIFGGTYETLATFTGSSSATVTLKSALTNYKLLLFRVLDSNGAIIASAVFPPALAQINTYKLYGGASNIWGSVEFTGSTTTAVFNRTSATTTSCILGGIK